MLRVDRDNKTLTALANPSLQDVGIAERYGLQELIARNPQPFFDEMGEKLLLLGEEIRPSDMVDNRIDLLAIDEEGAAVVIELKRGKDRYQLLQALSYAAMIAEWTPEQIVDALAETNGVPTEEAGELVDDFLGMGAAAPNQQQRIILLAEAYDFEVLATAQWLSDHHELDIRCYQVKLATDNDGEYLNCTCIFPAPELREHAARRSRRGRLAAHWPDWETALKRSENDALREFMLEEVRQGCENNLRGTGVTYRADGKRRLFVGARRKYAYVWQEGRFADDDVFWKEQLSPEADVKVINSGRSLSFRLTTKEDFRLFKEFIEKELPAVEFLEVGRPAGDDE